MKGNSLGWSLELELLALLPGANLDQARRLQLDHIEGEALAHVSFEENATSYGVLLDLQLKLVFLMDS